MIKPLQVPLLIMIFLFISCQKKISDLEFEKNVMTEIFPDLIDSICIDYRTVLNPLPIYGLLTYDENGHRIRVDSTMGMEEQKQRMAKWEHNQEVIEKDTSKLIVAFNPKIKSNNKDLKEYLEEHFKVTEVFYPKIEGDSIYTIDFKNIPLKGKFELRDISEFPKDRHEFWRKKYDFVFSGAVYFTGIQFDKKRKFGVLDGGFSCGRHCGIGVRIYIKKVNEKWIIDKIDNTSVS
ncbi:MULTISPECIES: hypothetical protein [unclassified Flavobacterium]|uniref:hypothetical protein n=1 Tax=unclassified Flavobacterium TaxID=196869 RepID=UPI0012A7B44A|nr:MULTISPECIES: hypothetical protein [unclassified Flavobacterium]MBF4485381.1 hypothetical protein [Flavobacterium sp. CSZ]QGK74543.1 hypothetical protein GIY83_10920 [Flavobacterium sp. SLB02]